MTDMGYSRLFFQRDLKEMFEYVFSISLCFSVKEHCSSEDHCSLQN